MFISRKEAEERLSNDRNIFKVPGASSVPPQVPPTQDPPAQDTNEEDEDLPLEESDAADIETLARPMLDLSRLDSLIDPSAALRRRGPKYAGRPQAQSAICEVANVLSPTIAGNLFGLDQSQGSRYGLVEQLNNGEPYVGKAIEKRLKKVKEELGIVAADRLRATLRLLSDEKLGRLQKAVTISKIAKDMATIMEKCIGDEEEKAKALHLHVYSPEVAAESSYPVVRIGSGSTIPVNPVNPSSPSNT